ncbi:MAG: HDOD domain-containing protein [Rhodothermales bacterium]
MPSSAAIPDYIHESVRALPVLPTAVSRLLTLTREVDVNFREIARVIETDQTLTARTLRAANSPLYSVSRRVQTVRQATVLLGTDTIVNLVLGVSVMSLQSGLHRQLPFDPALFGRHSIAVALAARNLAQHFRLPNPGEAFVAGLLHDIGKLVLLMHYGEKYAWLMKQALQGEVPLNLLEEEAFDLDHALVGHALCLHWHLPPAMAQAVAEHHSETAPRSLADMVSRANNLVKTIHIGNSGNCYIHPASVNGQPRDLIGQGWLRKMVLAHPAETLKAEEALGRIESVEEPEAQETTDPPLVQLEVRRPAEEEMLSAMLWSMGYELVGTNGGTTSNGHPASGASVALITDTPGDLAGLAYRQRNVPVLDYGAWRTEHDVDAGGVNVVALRSWLAEKLEAATTQA